MIAVPKKPRPHQWKPEQKPVESASVKQELIGHIARGETAQANLVRRELQRKLSEQRARLREESLQRTEESLKLEDDNIQQPQESWVEWIENGEVVESIRLTTACHAA